MKLILASLICLIAESGFAACPDEIHYPDASFPELTIKTNQGDVVIELDRNRAPLTVNHFLWHVKNQSYNNNLIHRAVPGYVIQSGAFNADLSEVNSCGTVFNESGNGLSNDRGTIAMARYDDPHSAGSSFYLNLADNNNLNPNKKSWGYTVFGIVVSGMDVLDKMAQTKTGYNQQLAASDVPIEPITIISVSLNP